MRDIGLTAQKGELDLNKLVYNRVKAHGIVPFRDITAILGPLHHINRKDTFRLLRTWEYWGWVKIHPYHGVKFLVNFDEKV